MPYRPNMHVISCLQWIAAHPVTTHVRHVAPVVWDCNCLEEVCGAFTMVINGTMGQSCSALLDQLLTGTTGDQVTLEPMSKFPMVRDLFVDRRRMFNTLVKIGAWVPIDGTHPLGPGPIEIPGKQETRYALSKCMTCGCCLEACPQFTLDNDLIGTAAISQVSYFNAHPTGQDLKRGRRSTWISWSNPAAPRTAAPRKIV